MATERDRLKRLFQEAGGVLRTRDILSVGIHPRTLYALRDEGMLEQLARGVYRLASPTPPDNPDLVTVGKLVPHGIICLISALDFHGLTDQVPHSVHLAIAPRTRKPELTYPPLTVYRFSRESYAAGVEEHDIDGVRVKVYDAEKTLADCFKFRSKIGMDVALDAMKRYFSRQRTAPQKIVDYARICRVENVMRPYLESNL